MEEVFFIDRDGNKISMDQISSHIGLANEIINRNEFIKQEFEKSGKMDPIDFLVSNKGYMKLTNQGFYRRCVYSSSKVSERQRDFIEYFIEEGYRLDDIEHFIERDR